MTFVSIYAYNNYTIEQVLKLACVMQFFGVWTRYLAYYVDSFYPVIFGTACCATTAPVFVNAASMLANNWFSDKERAFATAIGTIAMPVGTLATLTMTGIKLSLIHI